MVTGMPKTINKSRQHIKHRKMKKIVLGFLLIAGFVFSTSLNAEGWDYKSEESLDKMDGELYVRADCTGFAGDDCTTSGASWRMNIDVIEWVVSQMKKFR